MNYSKQSVIENQLILITPYNNSFAISFSHKIIRYERVHLLFSVERATTSINDDFFTSRFFSPFYRSIQNQTQILIVNACYNNIIPFFFNVFTINALWNKIPVRCVIFGARGWSGCPTRLRSNGRPLLSFVSCLHPFAIFLRECVSAWYFK